jgi:hypothetical protein
MLIDVHHRLSGSGGSDDEDDDRPDEDEREKVHKELYGRLLRKDALQVDGKQSRLLHHILDAIAANTAVPLFTSPHSCCNRRPAQSSNPFPIEKRR